MPPLQATASLTIGSKETCVLISSNFSIHSQRYYCDDNLLYFYCHCAAAPAAAVPAAPAAPAAAHTVTLVKTITACRCRCCRCCNLFAPCAAATFRATRQDYAAAGFMGLECPVFDGIEWFSSVGGGRDPQSKPQFPQVLFSEASGTKPASPHEPAFPQNAKKLCRRLDRLDGWM